MYRYIKKSLLLFACLFLCFSNSGLAQNQIFQLRSNSLSEKLQIVVDVAKTPNFNAFALSAPVRVVVDVKAQAATTYQNNLNFKQRGVTVVRTGMQDADTVRLVLDLNRDYHWKAYTLAADAKHATPRLVIDVYDRKMGQTVAKTNQPKLGNITLESWGDVNIPSTSQTVAKIDVPEKVVVTQPTVKKEAPKAPPKVVVNDKKPSSKKVVVKTTPAPKTVKTIAKIDKPTPPKKIKETTAKPLKQREIIVVIDPGHGGKDSGALGKHRTKEKTVVLQIAKRLKKKINDMAGMKAILTRHNDRYISLRGRLRLARKYKADLFVSIHADAALRRTAQGSSVYILSNRGASSEGARWLAKRENAVDLKYGVDIGDYDKDVSNMIMQIQQDATIESSHLLAKKTIQQLKGIGKVHKTRVERAGFAVLKSPDIPSMLVETAFISNPSEEQRLKSSSYQDKIATSIARGIEAYFAEHLPQHVLVGERE